MDFIGLLRAGKRYISQRNSQRKGYITLSIEDTTAKFIATSRRSIRRTRSRYRDEHDQLVDIIRELRSTDIFVDIGANTGLYTCFAAPNADQIIALEPYPPNFIELSQNVQLNEINAFVNTFALYDANGMYRLDAPAGSPPGYGKGAISSEKGSQVGCIRGDDLFTMLEVSPTVIKIDVEGTESRVIAGLESTLASSDCRLMYCELHPGRMTNTRADLVSTLRNFGFVVTEHFGRENLLKAEKSV